MQATGIHATLSFSLPRGGYTMREVVRELVQNHLAASDKACQCRRRFRLRLLNQD